jgi:hypothetical protein
MKRPLIVAALLVSAAVLIVATLPLATIAQDVQSVFVTNFPKTWTIQGSVAVDGPVKQAKLAALREVLVPPVNPKDTQRLIQGDPIVSDGFTHMVLSLQGQIKGEVSKSGTVGVILIPDEEPIIRAFDEKGIIQFPLEASASGVSAASAYFASSQNRAQIGFSRYRTYFYNTSDKTVTVNLYAYLTN